LSILACFFKKPWTQLADGTWQLFIYRANILTQVSYSLRALGRISEAVDPLKQALVLIVQTKAWHQECGACSNLSELQLALGEISNAVKSAVRAVEIADQHQQILAFEREGFRGRLAVAYFQKLDIDRAKALFQEAEALLRQRQPSHHFLYSLHGFFYSEVLMHDAEVEGWRVWLLGEKLPASYCLLDAVEDRAARVLFATVFESGAGQRDLGLHHLILCRSALLRLIFKQRRDKPASALDAQYPDKDRLLDAMGKAKGYLEALPKSRVRALDIALGKAEYGIEEALEALRASGDVEELLRGLLTRAWILVAKCHNERARNDLDEAWDIAERGPMRLHLADIHLHRARLFFRERPYPWKSPEDDLAAAEKLINDCGYHRRDEELADAKRAIVGNA
jgi:tetratricopeptide (TPR) repeat protein